MGYPIIRISRYAFDNIENAKGNLQKLKDLQTEINLSKQNIIRTYRNVMIHNIPHLEYQYKIIKMESEIKEQEQILEAIKLSFVSNICFSFSYASELLFFELSSDSDELPHRSRKYFREISSIINSIDFQMNIPLFSIIPKLVEVESKLLSEDNRSKYMILRMLLRDIKSKIG